MSCGPQTSAALTSALYQLAVHGEQQQALHAEVTRVLGRDAPLTASALEDMPYLRAVLKEVLRMYPVVIGNGRTLTVDTVVGGYLIPKGVSAARGPRPSKHTSHYRF